MQKPYLTSLSVSRTNLAETRTKPASSESSEWHIPLRMLLHKKSGRSSFHLLANRMKRGKHSQLGKLEGRHSFGSKWSTPMDPHLDSNIWTVIRIGNQANALQRWCKIRDFSVIRFLQPSQNIPVIVLLFGAVHRMYGALQCFAGYYDIEYGHIYWM